MIKLEPGKAIYADSCCFMCKRHLPDTMHAWHAVGRIPFKLPR